MTRKIACIFCVAVATLAILFFRLSATNAEVGGSNPGSSSTTNICEQGIVTEPKSMVGVRSVMAVMIKEVLPGSPAEAAGLRPGDLITALEGQIESIQDFQGRIGNSEPGTSLKFKYQRFNQSMGAWEEHQGTIQTRSFRPAVQAQNAFVKVSGSRLNCPYGCCEFCTRVKCPECLVAGGFTGKINCRSGGSDCWCATEFCT